MHSVAHYDGATLMCSMTHYDCHSHHVLYDTLWLWHTHHVLYGILWHRPSLNVLYGPLCLWHTHAFYDTLCFVTHCDWHTYVPLRWPTVTVTHSCVLGYIVIVTHSFCVLWHIATDSHVLRLTLMCSACDLLWLWHAHDVFYDLLWWWHVQCAFCDPSWLCAILGFLWDTWFLGVRLMSGTVHCHGVLHICDVSYVLLCWRVKSPVLCCVLWLYVELMCCMSCQWFCHVIDSKVIRTN